jgi:hypothetical protein
MISTVSMGLGIMSFIAFVLGIFSKEVVGL